MALYVSFYSHKVYKICYRKESSGSEDTGSTYAEVLTFSLYHLL